MSALAAAGAGAVDLVQRAGVALILAQPGDPDPSNGKGPEWGKAAPIGLLVIALLCISLFFLVKSMNKRIKAVPTSFAAAPVEPAVAVSRERGAPESGTMVDGTADDPTATDDAAPSRSGPTGTGTPHITG